MLAAIKLPERRNAAPIEQQRRYDTSLSIDPKNAATAAVREAALQKVSDTARSITESLQQSNSPIDDVRALHTLKDDLQHVVRDKKLSLVRAVALEEEKLHRSRALDTDVRVPSRASGRRSLAVAAILLLLGCIAIGGVLFVMAERSGGTAAPITAAVLFAEQNVPLPIDGLAPADIRREIGNARFSNTLTLGAILEIIPVTQTQSEGDSQVTPVTFSEFLTAIGADAPDGLTRSLGDRFFLGLHTVDENAPIIVVPVTSYERAFAAMLEWERNINADLSPMFTAVSLQTTGPDGRPIERRFADTVIRNYDVRALYDDGGTIQLFYSFPTRNVLIIAESAYSFSEILSRLRADRKL